MKPPGSRPPRPELPARALIFGRRVWVRGMVQGLAPRADLSGIVRRFLSVSEQDQIPRLQQLTAQAHRNRAARGGRPRSLGRQEEDAFWRRQLAADRKGNFAFALEAVSVSVLDLISLGGVHQDAPKAVPYPLGGVPLTVLPSSDP